MSSSSLYRRMPLSVKRLSENAVLPVPGSEFAAGLDLSSAVALQIPAGQRALVKTDLSIACPPGTYARIAPRSGLALKRGIDVLAGVVDADYRGPVGVILFNTSDQDFEIQQGDRIAQLILELIVHPNVVEVDELPETLRGAGGFGSTGISATDAAAADEDESNKKQRTISPGNSPDPEESHPDPPTDADGMEK